MRKSALIQVILLVFPVMFASPQRVGPQVDLSLRGEAVFQDSFFSDRYSVPLLYGMDALMQLPVGSRQKAIMLFGNSAVTAVAADTDDSELWSTHFTVVDRTLLGMGYSPGLDSPFTFMAGASLGILTGIVFPDPEYFSTLSPALSSQLGVGAYGGVQFSPGSLVIRAGYSWYPNSLLFGYAAEADRINSSSLDVSVGFRAGRTVDKLEEKEKWEPLIRYYAARGDEEQSAYYAGLFRHQMLASAEAALAEDKTEAALGFYKRAGLDEDEYTSMAEGFARENRLDLAAGLLRMAGLSAENAPEKALDLRNDMMMTLWMSDDDTVLGLKGDSYLEGTVERKLAGTGYTYNELLGLTEISVHETLFNFDAPGDAVVGADALVLQRAGEEREYAIASLDEEALLLKAPGEGGEELSYKRKDQYKNLVILHTVSGLTEAEKETLYLELAEAATPLPGIEYYVSQGKPDMAVRLIEASPARVEARLYYYDALLKSTAGTLKPYWNAYIHLRVADTLHTLAEATSDAAGTALDHAVKLTRDGDTQSARRVSENVEFLQDLVSQYIDRRDDFLRRAEQFVLAALSGGAAGGEDLDAFRELEEEINKRMY